MVVVHLEGKTYIFVLLLPGGQKNGIEKNLNKFCCHKHEIHLGHCHIAHSAEIFSEAKCPFVSILWNIIKSIWYIGIFLYNLFIISKRCNDYMRITKPPFCNHCRFSFEIFLVGWIEHIIWARYQQCLADDTKQVEEMNRASVASTKEIPWVSFSEMSFAALRSKGFRHLPQDIVIFVRF